MKLMLMAGVMVVVAAGCSSGGDEPSNDITRIDGPAVVDRDQGGADNSTSDDPSDG